MWSGARLKRVNAMNDEQRQFLSLLRQPPARLTVEQTAWVLNCQPGDIAVLVAARLLKPLGNPLPNGTKYFGGTELLQLAGDRVWLARVTTALQQYWLAKNRRRNGHATRAATSKPGMENRQPARA
jgi:hypothetical protein